MAIFNSYVNLPEGMSFSEGNGDKTMGLLVVKVVYIIYTPATHVVSPIANHPQ